MPTYEYECEKCGRVFEEFQTITAPPLTTCRFDGCGGKVRRLLSGGSGFLFKGSGFYITDYRSESYKQKAKAEKEGSGLSSGSSSSSGGASSSPAPSSSGTESTTAASSTQSSRKASGSS